MNPFGLVGTLAGAAFAILGLLLARGVFATWSTYATRLLLFGPALFLMVLAALLTDGGLSEAVTSTLYLLAIGLFVLFFIVNFAKAREAYVIPREVQPALQPPVLHLALWDDSGLQLLRDCNSAEMTEYLGGPETEEKLLDRQRRYLTYTGNGAWSFRVVFDGDNVGSVNYWEDDEYYEMGWAIAPLYQGLGFAKEAVALALAHAAASAAYTTVHAMPSLDNAASNGVARSVGFTNIGQRRIEYPIGHFMVANDWVYDLRQLQGRAN